MGESKPWALKRWDSGYRQEIAISNGDRTIASKVWWVGDLTRAEEAEVERELAKAAAAPDMLEALNRALRWWGTNPSSSDRAMLRELGAAIAKAEGREP